MPKTEGKGKNETFRNLMFGLFMGIMGWLLFFFFETMGFPFEKSKGSLTLSDLWRLILATTIIAVTTYYLTMKLKWEKSDSKTTTIISIIIMVGLPLVVIIALVIFLTNVKYW